MKIAIVAPSPIPFTVGGAEKLWWGMLEYINKNTYHQCELIKIPTKENNFWDLIESYYKFYKLDLTHFDLIISTKYPAWMVNHPNHYCYLQHCLRGLYDTYHLTGLPYEVNFQDKKILKVLNFINENKTDIDYFFEILFDLKHTQSLPETLFSFPGPFIRKIIHHLDWLAMRRIKKFFAISRTVKNRKEYFPKGINVKIIYHPSNLEGFYCGNYDYFFTASRLDNAKRIDILIEAYLKSKVDIPLKIAGTGPLKDYLTQKAQGDKRIEFLGFVSDDELVKLYANAYAVIFIPYDEDYGLVTIEAMMSKKPVLTFSDSGGVTEFVIDERTGYVTEPSIENLTYLIEKAACNPKKIKQMGKLGYEKVKNITWENTIKALLTSENHHNFGVIKKKQKKVLVLSTYPVFPPRGGGQNRVYYLYREIAKKFNVKIISLVHEKESLSIQEIAPNLYETRIPKTQQHAEKEWEMQKKAGIPVTDIGMISLYKETPQYIEAIKESIDNTDYLVLEHPYTFPIVEYLDKYLKNKIVIHESQNVEFLLKKQMLGKSAFTAELLKQVFDVEKKACLYTDFTIVCTLNDAFKMKELYGLDLNKVQEIPNGVDIETVKFIPWPERLNLKKSLGFNNIKIAIFIGSWHQPNIEAVEKIFDMAKQRLDFYFIIIGSVGLYFADKAIPKNVGFMGIVDDDEKQLVLSIADIALNPMLTGSGTNLKMLDYLLAGVPVISTSCGVRGLNLPFGCVKICNIENFSNYFDNLYKDVNIEKAYRYVKDNFDWKKLGEQYLKILEKM